MSIVKDAERMGDYAKNIMDMAQETNGSQTSYKYFATLESIQGRIKTNLAKLKKAYEDSDGDLASEILGVYAPIKNECKTLISSLLKESLTTQEAVATALVAKYLGRVGSHMGNIASGIIYPLDKIDFVGHDAEE